MKSKALLTDLYQLTMMQGYSKDGKLDKVAIFDVFYRGTNHAVACGLEQALEYILNLRFEESDINYLRSLKIFDEEFLKLLKDFKFSGDVYAIKEGSIIFPQEPFLTIKARLFEAQLIETALLAILNYQTLVASKAAKVVYAAKDKSVADFSLRRAQGFEAGVYSSRAAYIAGVSATSNVLAGKMFNIPVTGTHAHAWVMSFDSELEAFRAYAKAYPDSCLLLVDTYDTLNSGLPNAITVFKELVNMGHRPLGIRLDSGDLAYLSKRAREILDEAGFKEVKIYASGDIDENIIASLESQYARIDGFGVGTKLVSNAETPSLNGVYKLAAITEDGILVPKLKASNTLGKITNPGFKKVVRIYDRRTKKAEADLICLMEEDFDDLEELEIFDPRCTYKRKTLRNFYTKTLTTLVVKDGKLVYDLPSVKEIASFHKEAYGEFWDEYKRALNPQKYKVDLSQKLFDTKEELLRMCLLR
ncbi:nicotinate phosphoribosyltransferase [Helicobacter sp. 13S00401-1]|uniref:nicotinate phosphoribosyltransferase n=1 Tax=Helicobacter sp. 13S00401-1 TaxID=1905758 RepID=UPI000BA5BDC0|nr:nicotinate phosphoribosyltransferase [Helicobacter sp. 13S00401-1]PAF50097.1 nicotinate phosphoribosyltransferase [Helicobacter sp. 13S00401-1]